MDATRQGREKCRDALVEDGVSRDLPAREVSCPCNESFVIRSPNSYVPRAFRSALQAMRAAVAWGLMMAVGSAGAAGATPAPTSDVADAEDPRLYLGMWTAHVRHISGGLDSNRLIGVSARGFYGATFVNSYGNRSLSAGIQRSLAESTRGSLAPSVGFRLGLVTGYDERLTGLAARTPVLPLVQVVGRVEHGRLGAELGYSGLALSLSLNGRL